MEPTEQLSAILPAVSALVDRIEPADLHRPTPCANFDVRGVLDHMMGLGATFSFMFRGQEPPAPSIPADHATVPSAEMRAVMDGLLDAVRSDGAMGRTIASPVGEMSGETFARLVAFDGLVHGWDIARATGQPFDVPDDVVAEVDAFARAALTDDMRDGDMFKTATTPPDRATPIERVAAFSGRTI